MFNNSYNYKDAGLLILRIGIGLMFVLHGFPKMMGGKEKWVQLGEAMQVVGISQYPEIWGYLAAFAELVGGILLMFGLLHRAVCFLLFFTMVIAAAKHLAMGDGIMRSSHAIESAVLFFSLMFIGPGRISVDQVIFGK